MNLGPKRENNQSSISKYSSPLVGAKNLLEGLFLVISELQILVIILTCELIQHRESNNELVEFLRKISEVILWNPTADNNDQRIALSCTFFTISILLIIITILIGILNGFSLSLPKVYKSWQFIIMVYYTVLSIMFINIAIDIILSKPGGLMLGLNIVTVLLNIALGLVASQFCFTITGSEYLYARRSSICEQIGFLIKTFNYILILVLKTTTTANWIRIVIILVMLISRIYHYSKIQFYHYTPLIIFFCFNACGISLIISKSINAILKNEDSLMIYCFVISLPISIKICLIYLNNILDKYSKIPNKELKRPADAFRKVSFITKIASSGSSLTLLQKKTQLYELYYQGILKKSIEIKEDFNLQNRIEHQNSYQSAKLILNKVIEDIYKYSITKFQDKGLKLCYAEFLIQNSPKSIPTATSLIYSCIDSECTLSIQTAGTHLLRRIEQMLLEKHKEKINNIDMAKIHDFCILRTQFYDKMTAYFNDYIKFWENYQNQNCKMCDILEDSYKLDLEANKINILWDKMVHLAPHMCKKEHIRYGLYLKLTRNAPFSAESLLKKYFVDDVNRLADYSRELSLIDLEDKANIQLFISMKKDKLGDFYYVSPSIKTLGYSTHEIQGKNINMLIPNYYRSHHQKTLMKYLEESKDFQILFHNRNIFIQKKDGSFSHAEIYIAPVPHVTDDFMFGVFIGIKSTEEEYLVLSRQGEIKGASSGLVTTLNLNFLRSQLFQELCLEGDQIVEQLQRGSAEHLVNNLEGRKIEFKNVNVESTTKIRYQASLQTIKLYEGDLYLMTLQKMDRFTNPDELSSYDIEISEENHKFIPMFFPKGEDEQELIKKFSLQEKRDMEKTSRRMERQRVLNYSDNMSLTNEGKKISHTPQRQSDQGQLLVSTTGSTANLDKNINLMIENAIHYKGIESNLTVLKYSALIHMILSIGLLIFFSSFTKEKIKKLPLVMDVSTANFTRNYWIVIWMLGSNAMIDMMLRGYFEERFFLPKEILFYWWAKDWYVMGEEFIKQSHMIQNSTYLFEEDNRKFFDRPLKYRDRLEPNKVIESNLFTFDAEMANACFRLMPFNNGLPEDFDVNNPDFVFTLNNVMDQNYIREDELYQLVRKDIKDKLESITNFATINSFIISGLEFFLFVLTLYGQLKFLKRRKNFAEIFTHIRDQEVSREIEYIKSLKMSILNTEISEGTFNNLKKKIQSQHRNRSKDMSLKAKPVNLYGFNAKIYLLLFGILIFQTIIMASCILIFTTLIQDKSHIDQQVDRGIEANILFNQFGAILASLWGYIVYDKNTILRGKPIEEEWNVAYKQASESTEFFNQLRMTDDTEFLSKLEYILTDDLCTMVYATEEECLGGREEAKAGLLSLNSLLVHGTKTVKVAYDHSNRTFEAKREVVGMEILNTMEWAFWLYIPPAYQELEKLLKENILQTINEFNSKASTLISCFAVFFLVTIQLVWVPIWRKLRNERYKIQIIFRIIPINIVRKNAFLKNYLISNSNNILMPVRHLL